MKTTREELLARWKDTFPAHPSKQTETAIHLEKRTNLFSTPEFQQGLFEMQDEGSQLLAQLVAIKPGQQLLDFCAGSGGKTLAIAPRMAHRGQIWVHDIRPKALEEAKKRLRRAGVQNAQTILEGTPHLKKLKKKMDWVLVDAPCSGTGTLRRNPDMKWKYSDEMLQRLIGQQRTIFESGLSFLKPGGKIVYCTCSILPEENEKQADHFIKTYDLKPVGPVFQCFPSYGEMDGFYGIVLERK